MTIIMMHGLPCSGKSYLARKISEALPNAVVLKTVSFRRVSSSGPELFDETDQQTKEDKDESYLQLCARAKRAIEQGRIPILDATFHKMYRRKWVYGLAKDVVVVAPVCSRAEMLRRLEERRHELSEDAFLKSMSSFEMMESQNEPITGDVNCFKVKPEEQEEFILWLKSTLS